jgi:Spy/CpxP family protein refolding chaperone
MAGSYIYPRVFLLVFSIKGVFSRKGERKMKKTVFASVGVLVLLAFPILAMAQGWELGRHPGMGYGPSGMEGWASRLNLSPEQIQKIEALHGKFLEETLPIADALALDRVELRTLWLQANPEEGKILAKEKEMNGLKAQIQEKETKYLLEARKVLTPEQQLKAATFFMREGFWSHQGRAWGNSYCPIG